MMNDNLIGISGYDYPEWKGVFYPENLKRKDLRILCSVASIWSLFVILGMLNYL